ncbi:MAG: alkaline phosphatase family protein [Acidobacteria bacterium]|nr:alkaline phosphatase family protein [Acidobacteriota bacterium]
MKSSRREFCQTVAAAAAMTGCGAKMVGDPNGKKVVVLGLDGMEPKIIQALMDQGRAPNFKKLAQMGAFKPLQTTMPALSPVAWSSFITGMTPGGHGVPDFIARDPLTYAPFFAIWKPGEVTQSVQLGDYQLALSGGEVECLRRGKPFWAYLTEAGIPATVMKIPTNFPIDETATRAVAGMGTPDVVDSFGAFSYYTSDPDESIPNLNSEELIRIRVNSGRVDAEILGPPNSMNTASPGRVRVPFQVYVDPTDPVVRIDVQDQQFVLQEGEFSDWIKLRFELVPGGLVTVAGITRILVKSVHPHFKMYVSPINIDPEEQAMPVTHPPELGGEIADKIGPFWTKGLPADTKAFDYKIFEDEHYVKQAELILQDQLNLFEYEWSQFKSGLFYFYISSTDQDTHMLWRNMDETHPMHQMSDVRYSGYIHQLYEKMDALVGRVLPSVDDDTLLIVCSDHGFAQFGRQFHLNTWLRENGYLVLKDEAKNKPETNFLDVNWDKTAAYNVGFNGLYLNRVGREERGIVSDEQAGGLIARITRELQGINDSETGERPIHKVFARDDIYVGEHTPDMPEMLVGCTPGYRISSSSVQLETGKTVLDLNPWAWAGDHSMSRDMVPGSLFISRGFSRAEPSILDLPVTILDFFGFERPEQMVGRSLFDA